ncbi:MAG: Fe-S cluster assembly ATPase SufC [Bacteroidales bacterium]|nr:Fe-S cluster assembly ATPase SufC [Bacteroidales bacterium]
MLSIKDLSVSINGKTILDGFNLEVKAGEVHAIMGPNGTGKSTLASVIAGRDMFDVDRGEITYRGQNLFDMAPEIRAREGIFLGFQYPVEIPGVSMASFMRTAINEKRKHLGLEPMSGAEFLKLMEEKKKLVEIQSKLTNRSVNEGFSGGEKKKNEIFQMALLEPRLAILDETDSGLDIDALKVVANGVNKLRSPENATIIITHYQRLLDFIIPDYVHVLFDGRIVKSGDKSLALELESKGYEWVKKEANMAAAH